MPANTGSSGGSWKKARRENRSVTNYIEAALAELWSERRHKGTDKEMNE
jgi:hypothetical protein